MLTIKTSFNKTKQDFQRVGGHSTNDRRHKKLINEIYYLTYHWSTNIQKHAKHRFPSILIDNEQEYANLT